jgi:hypothetical protein
MVYLCNVFSASLKVFINYLCEQITLLVRVWVPTS